MNPDEIKAEWFALRDARFCGNCEVVYFRETHQNWCPHCGSGATVQLTRWIKPLSEAKRDDDETAHPV